MEKGKEGEREAREWWLWEKKREIHKGEYIGRKRQRTREYLQRHVLNG